MQKKELKTLAILIVSFSILYAIPVDSQSVQNAVIEAVRLVHWYAQEHVLTCLLPAFFIAGSLSVFLDQAAVIKYLGASANRVLSYAVASISGTVLSVCSCTVLPLFAGIYKMGAGLGPATAFLYSGPAINIMAITLTARVLGTEYGVARAVGAIVFSVVIGLTMHFIYKKDETAKEASVPTAANDEPIRPLWINTLFLFLQIAILVFATWGKPEGNAGIFFTIYQFKWLLVSAAALALGILLLRYFAVKGWHLLLTTVAIAISVLIFWPNPVWPFVTGIAVLSIVLGYGSAENKLWLNATWGFAKQMLPLLLGGVLVAGFLLGSPGGKGIVPDQWITALVGGNSIWANFFASIIGAFMYFATLTEVPIVKGLIENGMGKGPALALLLAGPALSLPNMLVIRSVLGNAKTITFIALVVLMSTVTGIIFGYLA